ADAVQAQRVVAPQPLEPRERGAAFAEEILAMDFEEADRRQALRDLAIVRRAQSDAGRGRRQPRRDAIHGGLLRSRLAGLALGARARFSAELLAGALGDVLPFVGSVVARRLAGARMARGAAVVLARLGDAVALFLRVLGGGVLRRSERDERGDRRRQELLVGRHGQSSRDRWNLTIEAFAGRLKRPPATPSSSHGVVDP